MRASIAIGTALISIALLKVSVWFPSLFGRSQDFTFQVTEVLSGQTNHIVNNALMLLRWLTEYQGWLLFLAGLAGMLVGLVKKQPVVRALAITALMFSLPFVILGKVLAPRYYLMLGLIWPITAGYLFSNFTAWLKLAFVITFLAFAIPRNTALLSNPLAVRLPATDESQYLTEWSSGIGIAEAVSVFRHEAKDGKIKVLTEGYFGTLPDGLFVLLYEVPEKPNIEIVGVGEPFSDNFNLQVANTNTDKIFYIGNKNRISQESREKMELIAVYLKKDPGAPLEIYRVSKPL